MSEYQYLEFSAIDQPLDGRQLAEIRSLSTRARITATSFVNEYQWGDFGGDPSRMMEAYYDAHLYLANWGTHRVMFRLPRRVLDIDVAGLYCVDDHVTVWTTDEFILLDLVNEDDSADWDDAQTTLSSIVGVRAEITTGDLRPLYVAWLAGQGDWVRDEHTIDDGDLVEPPVPPGLSMLTAAQRELADFLRVDDDLLAVAARTSPALGEIAADSDRLADWVMGLTLVEKDRLIMQVISDGAGSVRSELLRRFRHEHGVTVLAPPRRRVADLVEEAARRRADRERQEAARRSEEEGRRQLARSLAHERRLEGLATDEPTAWSRVDAMIATRKPTEYAAAVLLLTDLRTLAERSDRYDTFYERVQALRQTHARKTSLIERLDRAGV